MRLLPYLALVMGLLWGASAPSASRRCADMAPGTSASVLLDHARQAARASDPKEALCFAKLAQQSAPPNTTAWAVLQLTVGIYSEQAGDTKGAVDAYVLAASTLDPETRAYTQWTSFGTNHPLLLERNGEATTPLRLRALQQARGLLPQISDSDIRNRVLAPLLTYAAATGDEDLLDELIAQSPCEALSPEEDPWAVLSRCTTVYLALDRRQRTTPPNESFAGFEQRWKEKGWLGLSPPASARQQAHARTFLKTLEQQLPRIPKNLQWGFLSMRAVLYDALGDAASSRKSWQDLSQALTEQLKDPQSQANAISRCSLEMSLASSQVMSQSPDAAPLLAKARASCDVAYPTDSMTRALMRSGLDLIDGLYACYGGRWADAEKLFRQSLTAYDRAETLPGPTSGGIQRSLTAVYLQLGDRAAAQRAFEASRRDPTLSWASTFNRLAFPADRAETIDQARTLLDGYAMLPDRQIQPLSFLALMQIASNDYPGTDALLKRMEAIHGTDPWRAAATAEFRAVLAARQGKRAPAFQALERALALREQTLPELAAFASGPSLEALLEPLARASEFGVALCLSGACGERESTTALTGALRQKGRALDLEATSLQLARSASNPDTLRRYEALRAARAQLAQKSLAGEDTSALATEIARMEQELEGSAPALAYASTPVSVEAVRARLGPDDALIEFVVYRPYNLNFQHGFVPWGAPRYAAAVLRPGKAPAWRDLGSVAELDPLIAGAREVLADDMGMLDAEGAAQALDALDARLLRPLDPLLSGASRWYLAPDGALNLIPFGALRDAKGAYRLEKIRLVLLTSGRELLGSTTGPGPTTDVLIGAPDYGPAPAGAATDRALGAWGQGFSPLPGALQEVRALRKKLDSPSLLTGADATESAIKALQGPRILHIATHGFFLTDAMDAADLLSLTLDPMLRSGLALAGVNVGGKGGEDGLLTALETAGLNLRGTELVVLSACETGVGTVRTGEGVQGMRRALTLAGAESEVLSLWKVDDEATLVLMQAFYGELRTGADRAEALRKAQLALARSADFGHPTYWAAWVLSGEDGPLTTR